MYFDESKIPVLILISIYTIIIIQKPFDILTLRSDGGGEFKSKEFFEHLATKGTKHGTSCSNTPSQNGISERFNRTVMEAARCILHPSNAPLWLWSEAVNGAKYFHTKLRISKKMKQLLDLPTSKKERVSR